jgi:transcriptional regulator with XRE-family HTH domain
VFTETILPGLKGLSAGQVARAVGIGAGYASQILKGQRVPHPRLWEELQRIACVGTIR